MQQVCTLHCDVLLSSQLYFLTLFEEKNTGICNCVVIYYTHMTYLDLSAWEGWFCSSQSALDLTPFPCERETFVHIHLDSICVNLLKNSQMSHTYRGVVSPEYCKNKSCCKLVILTTF